MAEQHVIDFRALSTVGDLSVALGIRLTIIERILNSKKSIEALSLVYLQHRIPKKRPKNGQFRIVWAPLDKDIRDAHIALARRFEIFARDVDPRFPHPCSYGYVRGRGTRQNAHKHSGHRKLLCADIEQFFPTITQNRLVARFLQIGLKRPIADALAGLATINGSLAMGLNASPMLANLVCTSLDMKLQGLAEQTGCTYTRYADDLAISGNQVPSRMDIEGILETEGFRLAKGKFRVTTLGQAHFVTGLSVSDPNAPHVPRNFKRTLRQELYYCKKFGITAHLKKTGERTFQQGVNRLDGTVKYVASIELAKREGLSNQWRKILTHEGVRLSYLSRHNLAGVDGTIFVDESEILHDGGTLLALSCVATEAPESLATTASDVLRQHQADPFTPGRKARLAAKGLHFTDAPEELRAKFIEQLPFLSFRSYLAFGLMAAKDYQDLYIELLGRLLPNRLRAYDGSRLTLVFEENTKVDRVRLERLVNATYAELSVRNERRPIANPTVIVGSKDKYPEFSVPDFLLGVFARYFSVDAKKDSSALTADRGRFERLRDKYRYIVNVDNGESYSRRHPLEI